MSSQSSLSPRASFIHALERHRPIQGARVPHFELEFFLTMEALGRVHASQRTFRQWVQMSEAERDLHRRDLADLHVAVARKYEHSAILCRAPGGYDDRGGWNDDDFLKMLEHIRDIAGDELFLMVQGDATLGLPNGDQMLAVVEQMASDPNNMLDESNCRVDAALVLAERYRRQGVIDGFALCADYCFNNGPFLSPAQFAVFIAPFLKRLIDGYREMGFYVIKHTDGNIMPILDQLLDSNPHALHSLDPQGGVDIAEVKRVAGDKVCLIGNVSCAALDTGTREEVVASARYALKHGMPGGGYIFSTSNCIYSGMPLERYEWILDVWRTEGVYK